MSKRCISCGELNKLHKNDHPSACIDVLQDTITELTAALYSAVEEAWQSEVIDTLMEEHIEESKSDWMESRLSEWKGED